MRKNSSKALQIVIVNNFSKRSLKKSDNSQVISIACFEIKKKKAEQH